MIFTILLTKTTAAQNEVALRYYRVRGLYLLAVDFAATACFAGMNSLGCAPQQSSERIKWSKCCAKIQSDL